MSADRRTRAAEAVHAARFPYGRQVTPFARLNSTGRAYCFRIADAVLAAVDAAA